MWIFLNNAMLSIVDPQGTYAGGSGPKSAKLLVRARIAGDIEAVFPHAKVERTPSRDYLFRALLGRVDVIAALARSVQDMDYANFKGSVTDQARHDAYLGVWGVMHREQERQRNAGARKVHLPVFPDPDHAGFGSGRINRGPRKIGGVAQRDNDNCLDDDGRDEPSWLRDR